MLSNPISETNLASSQRVVARTSSVAGSRSQNRQTGESLADALVAAERKSAAVVTLPAQKSRGALLNEDSFKSSTMSNPGSGDQEANKIVVPIPEPLTVVELRFLSMPASAGRDIYGGVVQQTSLDLFA